MKNREEILKIFDYDKNKGELYWKVKPSQRIKIGNGAGWNGQGYRLFCYQNKKYLVHRLIWLIENGMDPIGDIDHLNGNRADNRIENLRECTRRQNTSNKECHRKGHLVGTCFRKLENIKIISQRFLIKPWQAKIQLNGKVFYLGSYFTQQEAHQAYLKALSDFELKNKFPDKINRNKIRRSEFRRKLEILEKQIHET
jgi:hypothetical protein